MECVEEHECLNGNSQYYITPGWAVSNIIFLETWLDEWGEDVPGDWFMSNGEYISGPIVACPFCGERLYV